MAAVLPYSIPLEFLSPPPLDHLQVTVYIKHVEIRGKMVRRFTYDKLRTSLLSEYLIHSMNDPHMIDRLMTITFKKQHKNDTNNYCLEILRRGVELGGELFYFFGHSNSQLKDKTCYLIHATHVEIHDLLARFSDFSKISKIEKRAKRIALLFSGFNKSLCLGIDEHVGIDDVEHDGHNFTDGCGMMSEELAREIKQSHRLSYEPSVVQIRYQGYKGVLLYNPQLQGVKAQFRKSMKKFTMPDGIVHERCITLGVVEYSKPFSNAFLNTQLTMVLADNHQPHKRDYFLQLQTDFYDILRQLSTNIETAQHYLTITGRTKLLARLQGQGMTPRVRNELRSIQRDELRKMLKDDNTASDDDEQQDENRKSKLRVLVPKARIVFGVSDPYGELEYGEVFFRPTLPDIEIASFADASKVVVGRNPCYHPGDVRVLKLVKAEDALKHDKYVHLFDCIVFPVKGPRPHPHECSGGDLDGDKYFVSWDKQLVPDWTTDPFKYDQQSPINFSATLEKLLKDRVMSPLRDMLLSMGQSYMPRLFGTKEQAIQTQKIKDRYKLQTYFACYENDLVCRVNAIFMKYAARDGPACPECVELNEFFSDAVDMNADREKVETKLRNLERKFRLTMWQARGDHIRRQSYQIRRHHIRSDEANNRLHGLLSAPVMLGDAVWTSMEQNAERFVQEMRPYL